MRRTIAAVLVALGLVGCSGAPDGHDEQEDVTAIETALHKWPEDFNTENSAGVCGLFADDAMLAYPGGEDRGRNQFCAHLQELFDDPAKKFTYAQPDIREVLVDGDLASVKLFWTLTVTDKAGKVLETVVEDGVDVFQRQPDGSWKIHISHAFTK